MTGCQVTVQGQPAGTTATPVSLSVTDCSFAQGAIGVGDFTTTASWRKIRVTVAG